MSSEYQIVHVPGNSRNDRDELVIRIDVPEKKSLNATYNSKNYKQFANEIIAGGASAYEQLSFAERLGLPPRADGKQIRRAYTQLALKLHPDNIETKDGQLFKLLLKAYDALSIDSSTKDKNDLNLKNWKNATHSMETQKCSLEMIIQLLGLSLKVVRGKGATW